MQTSRPEASRVLALGAAKGSLSSDDRIYVARAIAARTSLSQANAERRVDAIFALVKTAADKVREATETARNAGITLALSVVPGADPIGSGVDNLARGDGSASAVNSGIMEMSRQEISRILLMGAANGSLSSDDRAYLVRVAARANLAQVDAEKRVDALSEQLKTSADNLRAATETARKGGILLAILTAASMFLGAAAAWWGAASAAVTVTSGSTPAI